MTVWEMGEGRWLKSVGSAEDPMAEDWFESAPQELSIVHFTKNPTGIRTGDLLMYYAAAHQKILGLVQVQGKAQFDAQLKRWPYFCEVKPKLMIKDIDRAPGIDVLSAGGKRDFRRTVQQLDYAVLEDAEYERGLSALEEAYDPAKGDLRDPYFNL